MNLEMYLPIIILALLLVGCKSFAQDKVSASKASDTEVLIRTTSTVTNKLSLTQLKQQEAGLVAAIGRQNEKLSQVRKLISEATSLGVKENPKPQPQPVQPAKPK